MSRQAGFNAAFVLLILIAACGAATYGFRSPASFESAARTAISSLSIIFGLSAAISSLIQSNGSASGQVSNDPVVAKKISGKLVADDNRTLVRQRALHFSTLISVILGLVYLVAVKDAPCAIVTRWITAAFVFGTSVSLLSTLVLPNLLISLVKRNAHLQSKRSME
ncbi:hypothetical protein [Ascidiaceihabitans sp.]|uniref:hypothetical protein n=1 Tax=Ascidiaceihabitans sp. TaxID=1872644 RepID=UPI003296B9C4